MTGQNHWRYSGFAVLWKKLQQIEVNQNVSQINHDWWKTNKSGNGFIESETAKTYM